MRALLSFPRRRLVTAAVTAVATAVTTLLAGVFLVVAPAGASAPAYTPPETSPFVDVPTDSQFYTEIAWLASTGITTGWADGTFRPGQPVNRDAMAAFLYRFSGRATTATPSSAPFLDVSLTNQFVREITWLASTQITTGWPDRTFRPVTAVSRDAMAAYLYRLSGSPTFTPPADSPFTDVTPTTKFYKEITWLASTEITTGYDDGSFRPLGAVNRDAMAAFLYRYSSSIRGPVTTRVVTASPTGARPNGPSYDASTNADGRFVAYLSTASNLVDGDTNGVADAFLWDRNSGMTSRIAVAPDGSEANGPTTSVSLSANGAWVAFASRASNLVPDDTNDREDVFLRERATGDIRRVNLGPGDTQASDNARDVTISANGRFITYSTVAANIVPGDYNGTSNIFVWDSETGTTRRVTMSTDGTAPSLASRGPAISADGRFIAYYSYANNLVAGDTNNLGDLFVWDGDSDTTRRISTGWDGSEANGISWASAVSANGRWFAFYSEASNLVEGDTNGAGDVFVWDRENDVTRRVGSRVAADEGNNTSWGPAISVDGRYVAYSSAATNLAPGDSNNLWDVYLWDRVSAMTRRASVAPAGTVASQEVERAALSASGRWVVYVSNTNGTNELYETGWPLLEPTAP